MTPNLKLKQNEPKQHSLLATPHFHTLNQFSILRALCPARRNQKSNGAPQKCVSFLGKRSKQTNGKRFDERQTVK